MFPATNDALTNAFQLLASIVREFHSQGRTTLGATLKPNVCTRGNFTEQMLGFRKFGDFLRAAQTAGYVQLRPTAGGDIAVWPASISSAAGRPLASSASVAPQIQSRSSSPSLRVRQDLWTAFNSFSGKWVYDPITDVAFRESEGAGIWNAPGGQPNLISVPAGRDRVLEWMSAFANTQDQEIKNQLLAALAGDAAHYHFTTLVRAKNLLRAWSHFHVQQVVAAIDAWAAANNLQPKNVTSAYRPSIPLSIAPLAASVQHIAPAISPPTAAIAAIAEAPRSPQVVGSLLTNRLESLVDDLIDELIRLRGLLQVVGAKQP